MSSYVVTVSASVNLNGGSWRDDIDLVEYGYSEEDAESIMKMIDQEQAGEELDDPKLFEEFNDAMEEAAINMSGYEWGCYAKEVLE